ncbi:TolC family protein [Rhodopirellula sp.]|nr:TolC family protein [Rhodopirellula sp.]
MNRLLRKITVGICLGVASWTNANAQIVRQASEITTARTSAPTTNPAYRSAPEVIATELHAEQGQLVTLDDLEALALKRSPILQQANSKVQAEKWRLVQAGLPSNPEAGIDFQQLGSDGLAEQYGIAISQELISPEKKRLNQSISNSEIKRLTFELRVAEQRLRTDVRKIHLRALRSAREVTITGQLLASAEKALQLTRELLEAREVSRADLLQAEVEVESTRIQNQQAVNAETAVWREIKSVTGVQINPSVKIAGSIDSSPSALNYEDSLIRILSQSPEISAAMSGIESARVNLQRQSVETRPNVTVGGLFNWRDNGINGSADGGLVVSIPLSVWNKNQGGIGVARSELVSAAKELDRIELQIAQRLAVIYQQYSTSADKVSRYQEQILPKTEEMLELTRESYELGEVGFVNLLAVQRTFANHQLAYLDAMEMLRLAEIEIDGMLLSDRFVSK